MAIAIITGYPPTQPGAQADLYAGRDPSIRGLFGLAGPRPGDSDYIAPLAPRTTTAAVVENPVPGAPGFSASDRDMKRIAIGLAVLAAVGAGLYFWTR